MTELMRLPGVVNVQCVEIERGVAQFGRVPALGAGSRRFESSRPDFSRPQLFHVIFSVESRFLVQG